jgi:hypothetical protein
MAHAWEILDPVGMEQYSSTKVTGKSYLGAIAKPPITAWK